jgi:hypothetical protein
VAPSVGQEQPLRSGRESSQAAVVPLDEAVPDEPEPPPDEPEPPPDEPEPPPDAGGALGVVPLPVGMDGVPSPCEGVRSDGRLFPWVVAPAHATSSNVESPRPARANDIEWPPLGRGPIASSGPSAVGPPSGRKCLNPSRIH